MSVLIDADRLPHAQGFELALGLPEGVRGPQPEACGRCLAPQHLVSVITNHAVNCFHEQRCQLLPSPVQAC